MTSRTLTTLTLSAAAAILSLAAWLTFSCDFTPEPYHVPPLVERDGDAGSVDAGSCEHVCDVDGGSK